jgi:hypothetical protein
MSGHLRPKSFYVELGCVSREMLVYVIKARPDSGNIRLDALKNWHNDVNGFGHLNPSNTKCTRGRTFADGCMHCGNAITEKSAGYNL